MAASDAAYSQLITRHRTLFLFITTLSGAALIGVVGGIEPLVPALVAAATFFVLVVVIWPGAATLAVVFILYTNAAVVAVDFHGVPFVVGASFPLLLMAPIAYELVARRRPLILSDAFALIMVFMLVQLVATLYSADISVSMDAFLTFLIEGVVIFLLITNAIRTPAMLRLVIRTLLLAGLLIGGLALLQQVTGTFSNDYGGFAQVVGKGFSTGAETLQGEVVQERLSGPIGEKNYFAQAMLMLVPLGVFMFLDEQSYLWRLSAIAAAVASTFGVILTFSRGAALAFGLLIAIVTVLRYVKLRHVAAIVLGFLLIIMVVPQYQTRLIKLQALKGVISSDAGPGISSADQSVQGRATETLAATLVFLDHPLLGVGPSMFKYYYQDYAESVGYYIHAGTREAHNLYLDIAAETGIFGLLCFLAIFGVTLRNLSRIRRHRPELANIATGLMLALISYLSTGMFLSLAYERYMWLMLGIATAANVIAGESQMLTLALFSRDDNNAGVVELENVHTRYVYDAERNPSS